MTDIDPKADIELRTVDGHVIVRVPLAGSVTDEWLRRYQRLARATGVPAQAEAAWIVVSLPADGNQREVAATMDAAHALIGEADAGERAPAVAPAESIVRQWWARRRESAPRRPRAKAEVVRTGIGYLYLGFTNATAFSPTDVMPLARWAKAVMTMQATASLAILGLVIARAVNILQ
jgi:hypothetical protein